MKQSYRFYNYLLLLGLMLVASCHSSEQVGSQNSAAPVKAPVAAVSAQQFPVNEEVIGTVRARVHAVVEAKTTGKVQQLAVRLGQRVAQGDLLLELDTKELKARQEQALAVRDQAARESRRRADLVARGAVSVQQSEEAASQLRVAEAGLVEAQTMLGYAQLRAPFDGVISKTLVDVGDLATPGKGLIEIDSHDVYRLECAVPEAIVSKLTLGAAIPILVPAAAAEVSGTVEEIAPSADAATRTSLVKIALPQVEAIRVGQFARARIPIGSVSTIAVPRAAVVRRGQLELVYVVDRGKAQMRLVRTGKDAGELLEILSGLAAGETIVTQIVPGLQDGVAIEG